MASVSPPLSESSVKYEALPSPSPQSMTLEERGSRSMFAVQEISVVPTRASNRATIVAKTALGSCL